MSHISIPFHELNPPHQLLIPGRGLEPLSAQFPGTVQEGSPNSNDSYERAEFAGLFAEINPSVERLIFTGGYTFSLPPSEVPPHSEAEAMAEVALRHEFNAAVVIRGESRTTFGNYLETANDLNLNEPIGLVAHSNHMKRALKIGTFVLPQAEFVPLVVDRDTPPQPPTSKDRLAAALYWYAMLGVTAGKRDVIQQQDEALQRQIVAAIGLIHTIKSLKNQLPLLKAAR